MKTITKEEAISTIMSLIDILGEDRTLDVLIEAYQELDNERQVS